MGKVRNNIRQAIIVYLLVMVVRIVLLYFAKYNDIFMLAVLIIDSILTGSLYWYCIRIYRNEDKPISAFSDGIKSGGWLVILNLVETMAKAAVSFFIMGVLYLFVNVICGEGKSSFFYLCYVAGMPIAVLFELTQLIYYDNRDKGPLAAVFGSIENVKKNYKKFLILYIKYFLIYNMLIFIRHILRENNLINIICAVYYIAVNILYIFKLISFYDEIILKPVEINDSLTIVAKALDDKKDNKY